MDTYMRARSDTLFSIDSSCAALEIVFSLHSRRKGRASVYKKQVKRVATAVWSCSGWENASSSPGGWRLLFVYRADTGVGNTRSMVGSRVWLYGFRFFLLLLDVAKENVKLLFYLNYNNTGLNS